MDLEDPPCQDLVINLRFTLILISTVMMYLCVAHILYKKYYRFQAFRMIQYIFVMSSIDTLSAMSHYKDTDKLNQTQQGLQTIFCGIGWFAGYQAFFFLNFIILETLNGRMVLKTWRLEVVYYLSNTVGAAVVVVFLLNSEFRFAAYGFHYFEKVLYIYSGARNKTQNLLFDTLINIISFISFIVSIMIIKRKNQLKRMEQYETPQFLTSIYTLPMICFTSWLVAYIGKQLDRYGLYPHGASVLVQVLWVFCQLLPDMVYLVCATTYIVVQLKISKGTNKKTKKKSTLLKQEQVQHIQNISIESKNKGLNEN